MKPSIWLGLCFFSACALSHERSEGGVSDDAGTDFGTAIDAAVDPPDMHLLHDAARDMTAPLDLSVDMETPCVDGTWGAAHVDLWSAFRDGPGTFTVDGRDAYVWMRVDYAMETALSQSYVAAFGLERDGTLSDHGRTTVDGLPAFPVLVASPEDADSAAPLVLAESTERGTPTTPRTAALTPVGLAHGEHLLANPLSEIAEYPEALPFAGSFATDGVLDVLASTNDDVFGARTLGEHVLDFATAPDLVVRRYRFASGTYDADVVIGRAALSDGSPLTLYRSTTHLVRTDDGRLVVVALGGIAEGSDPVPAKTAIYMKTQGAEAFVPISELVTTTFETATSLDVAARTVTRDGREYVARTWTVDNYVEPALSPVDGTDGSSIRGPGLFLSRPYRLPARVVVTDDRVVVAREVTSDSPFAATELLFYAPDTFTDDVDALETLVLPARRTEGVVPSPSAPGDLVPDRTDMLAFELRANGNDIFVLLQEDYAFEGVGASPWRRAAARLTRVSRDACP